jgi:hypothetical protein
MRPVSPPEENALKTIRYYKKNKPVRIMGEINSIEQSVSLLPANLCLSGHYHTAFIQVHSLTGPVTLDYL